MKKILFFACVAALGFSACNSAEKTEEKTTQVGESFGEKIEATDAKSLTELVQLMDGKDSIANIKVVGTIAECCQKKGCWMKLDMGNGETMRVSFKDYEFFVPKDAAGKKATIEGIAKIETTSLEDLKHYAKDAGKTEAEINAIVAPEKAMTFEAKGVIIQ